MTNPTITNTIDNGKTLTIETACGTTFECSKRALRKDGTLTKAGEKAYTTAQRAQRNAKMAKAQGMTPEAMRMKRDQELREGQDSWNDGLAGTGSRYQAHRRAKGEC